MKRLLFFFCLVLSISAYSQDLLINGRVTDKNDVPLAGVNISVIGKNAGTVSDANGEFSLNGPIGTELEFSFIGMITQKVKFMGEQLRIVMEDDLQALEEVMVVGYGVMRKKDLTGSIVQIRPDEIMDENPNSVQDILRNVAGLSVGYNADAKGGGSLSIRGQRSVYTEGSHNSPLLILDGMMFYGELSEINPDDIGQIDILKDASAAAIYGAKAANGVIIITTKKGKLGKPTINFNTSVGISQRSSYRRRNTPAEYLQHYSDWKSVNTYGVDEDGNWNDYQVGFYAGQYEYFTNPQKLKKVDIDTWRSYTQNEEGESDISIWAKRLGFTGNILQNIIDWKTVDWEDLAFRTGFNQDYNASVSGASERFNYYFSFGYLRNEGVSIDDRFRTIRSNLKLNAKVTNWLELGANINFQDRSDDNLNFDDDAFLRNSPFADFKDEDGNYLQYPNDETYSQRGSNKYFLKQYLELEKGYDTFNTIFDAKVSLPFGITYQFNVAPRFQFYYDRYFMSAELPGSNPNNRGVDREHAKRFDWSLNNTITWDKTFKEKHHIIITLVQEAEDRKYWSDEIQARNIQPSDALGFHNTQNGSKENSSFSTNDTHETADALLARLFYSYDNRYMLTSSFRRDGYSAFGSSNPYAYFPSVAVAWTFTNENFFNSIKNILSTGKLRLSYGSNGNRSLANPYVALANLSSGSGSYTGYINSSGETELFRYLMVDRMANPTLKWEKTQSWNFALDFGLLQDSITGTIEYYNMSTKDMIMSQPLQNFTGFDSITTNLGQVDNRGFELTLSTQNFDRENFKWSTMLTFSYNKNKIRHLFYTYDENGKEDDYIANNWFIGKPINEIWNYKVIGIWQKEEWQEAEKYGQVPGDPKVWNNPDNDIYNTDGSLKTVVYNDDDKKFLGQTTPPVNWTLRNNFVLWKQLYISFNLYSRMGHKSLSDIYLNNDDLGGHMSYQAANRIHKKYWTITNNTNRYARISAQGPDGAKIPGKLYDRSFIRFENFSISYSLPKRWISKVKIDQMKVSFSIRNLCSWAKDWEYGDPETGNLGVRIYNFGINWTL